MPIIPDYIAWLKNHFSALEAMSLRAVVDCGNGAGGTVLPALIDAMEWRGVTLLYPEVDGTFPHHEADPIVPENMHEVKEVLQTTDAALGIGLDGDADRMAPMTKSGYLVPGDVLLSIFAQPILEKNPGASIVFDLKSSAGLAESIIKHGGKPVMSASGHSIIKDVMREHKALVGGELSCHFFFADRYFGYDDGIYAMMRLFELLFESGKTLQELVDEFPFKCSSPEYRIACKPEEKTKIVATVLRAFQQQKGVSISTLDGVRVQFSDGWGIVRPSNTQAVMSMRFEADTNEGLGRIKKEFMLILESYFTKDVLSKEFGIE
jgi:phosphomannomutase/phosphoglucomutase